jgi:hypothetical protein
MLQVAQEPPWSSWEYSGLHAAALVVVLAVLFILHVFLKRGGVAARRGHPGRLEGARR